MTDTERDRLVRMARYRIKKMVGEGKLKKPGRCQKCGLITFPQDLKIQFTKVEEDTILFAWLCAACKRGLPKIRNITVRWPGA